MPVPKLETLRPSKPSEQSGTVQFDDLLRVCYRFELRLDEFQQLLHERVLFGKLGRLALGGRVSEL